MSVNINSAVITDCRVYPVETREYPNFSSINYAKNVKQLLNDRNLFWILFCKAYNTIEEVDSSNDELPTYQIKCSSAQRKHLKEIVEVIRKIMLQDIDKEQNFHFVNRKYIYHQELRGLSSEGRPVYDMETTSFGNWFCLFLDESKISDFLSHSGVFCSGDEFEMCLKKVIPRLIEYLGGTPEATVTKKKEFPARHVNNGVRRLFVSRTLHDVYHYKFQLTRNQPLKASLLFPTSVQSQTGNVNEIEAAKDAENFKEDVKKSPGKVSTFIEDFKTYLSKQKFLDPNSNLSKAMTSAMNKLSLLALTVSTCTAWSKVLHTKTKIKEIDRSIKKLTAYKQLIPKHKKVISIIVDARLDCLQAQKERAHLSLIGKSLKLMEKIISSLISFNEILLALDIAFAGAICASFLSHAAFAGLCLVVGLCAYKFLFFLYKNWDALPYIFRKLENEILLLSQTAILKYQKIQLNTVRKKIEELKSEGADPQAMAELEKREQELQHAISHTHFKRNSHIEKIGLMEGQIKVSYIKSRFKTMQRESLLTLYNLVNHEFNDPCSIKTMRNFLLKQDLAVTKNITTADIFNYIIQAV